MHLEMCASARIVSKRVNSSIKKHLFNSSPRLAIRIIELLMFAISSRSIACVEERRVGFDKRCKLNTLFLGANGRQLIEKLLDNLLTKLW